MAGNWILEKLENLDELEAKTELAFILTKFSEIRQQGYSEENLVKEIKNLYLKLGLDRY